MDEPVQDGVSVSGIAEDRGPFAEAQIGSDGDAGALVELAEQMEHQGGAPSAGIRIPP